MDWKRTFRRLGIAKGILVECGEGGNVVRSETKSAVNSLNNLKVITRMD